MIFLVAGSVRKTDYEGETRSFKVIRLVEAEDETEADQKFSEYFRAKTREYSTYYSATADEISEMIV
jgi:hypothetical protein